MIVDGAVVQLVLRQRAAQSTSAEESSRKSSSAVSMADTVVGSDGRGDGAEGGVDGAEGGVGGASKGRGDAAELEVEMAVAVLEDRSSSGVESTGGVSSDGPNRDKGGSGDMLPTSMVE